EGNCPGSPGSAVLISAIYQNGTCTFVPIFIGFFDDSGIRNGLAEARSDSTLSHVLTVRNQGKWLTLCTGVPIDIRSVVAIFAREADQTMTNIYDAIKEKENQIAIFQAQISGLQAEIEALRVAARILEGGTTNAGEAARPVAVQPVG